MENNQLKDALLDFLELIKNEITAFERGLTEEQKKRGVL